MDIIRDTKFKFIEARRIAFVCSAIVILAGIISLIAKGGPSYSIDFEGGTLIQLKFLNPVDMSSLRDTLKTMGYGDATIQEFGSAREVLIRVKEAEGTPSSKEGVATKIVDTIRTALDKPVEQGKTMDLNVVGPKELVTTLKALEPFEGDDEAASKLAEAIVAKRNSLGGLLPSFDSLVNVPNMTREVLDALKSKAFLSGLIVVRQEMVGPKVGKDLRAKALLSVFWAVLGILIYISIRFRFRFAVAAIVALIHDVLITVGVFSLFNREISLTIIAALLTIVGYSLNDTIVVFDRIRENSKALRSLPYSEQINASINMTLGRTLLTSLTTFIVVLSLFILGGEVIRDFALALMVGIVVGTYSSIFVASPVLYEWELVAERTKKGGFSSRGASMPLAAASPGKRTPPVKKK